MSYASTSESTMRDARAVYFADNQFGVDGGYASPWVDLHVGPVPLGFPNFPARKRAVQYHDMHHILTGYGTDWPGEVEIGAWELGAGCKHMVAAWGLNLLTLALGVLTMPRRTFAAFVRGRRSRSLYGEQIEELLAMRVGDVRQKMGVPDSGEAARGADRALFGAASVAGLILGTFALPLVPPFVGVGFVMGKLRG